MILYIFREALGLAITVLGIYLVVESLMFLRSGYAIIEGGICAMMGVLVLRGGLYLLRVAMASHVLLDERRRLRAAKKADAASGSA